MDVVRVRRRQQLPDILDVLGYTTVHPVPWHVHESKNNCNSRTPKHIYTPLDNCQLKWICVYRDKEGERDRERGIERDEMGNRLFQMDFHKIGELLLHVPCEHILFILKEASSFDIRHTFDTLWRIDLMRCDLPSSFIGNGHRVKISSGWSFVRFMECYQKSVVVRWWAIIVCCISMHYKLQSTSRPRSCRRKWSERLDLYNKRHINTILTFNWPGVFLFMAIGFVSIFRMPHVVIWIHGFASAIQLFFIFH